MKALLKHSFYSVTGIVAGCALLIMPFTAANAQEVDTETAVELGRDGDALRSDIRPDVIDRDRVDSALVFSNTSNRPARVRCGAFNHNGELVGSYFVMVPNKGLRYVLASDISNGADFVGSTRCAVRGHVVGSAFLLGPGITSMKVKQDRDADHTRMFFPVVATY